MEETRKTKWLHHGAFGVFEYRVWKRLLDGSWHQRHEYKMGCGRIEMGEWIPSVEGWIDDAERI